MKPNIKKHKTHFYHGQSNHHLYWIWHSMRQRCRNKNIKQWNDYGGRGITICSEWDNFGVFLADMGERPSPNHTLDRIDNDGNYCPENCRWATWKEQHRNTTRNHIITFNGITMCRLDWAIKTGIPTDTIRARIRRLGWSIEKSLTTPSRKRICK